MNAPIQTRAELRLSGLARASRRFGLAAVIALTALPVMAGNANFRMGFPAVINLPGPTFMQPPTIDGTVSGDAGWTRAFRYVFGNGTTMPDVVVQAIKDNNFIYLSFEAANDRAFEDEDLIVLTLDPSGVPGAAHRIHIFPVHAGAGAGAGGVPREVKHWSDSSAWNSPGAAVSAMPAGDIKVSSAGAAPNVTWAVELRLSRAAFGIPAAGDFGLYFNVIRVNAQPAGTAIEKYWPTVCPVGSPAGCSLEIGFDLEGNTPNPDKWGTASVSSSANGVSIDVADIYTDNVPPSKIAFPPGANTFHVNAHNNSIDSAGNPVAANAVTATFRIANFGIPAFGDWTLVPTGNNPTPAVNIPASGMSSLSTSPWALTPAQVTAYAAPHDHQCILVELDSTAVGSTVFVNKSAWRNFDFGPASVFEQSAEISGRGYGPPPSGGNSHQFDLHVTTKRNVLKRGGIDKEVGSPISQLTWAAHGYRHTGRYIIIRKKRFEIVDHAGSFGYLVQHAGAVADWEDRLRGEGLKQAAAGLYTLSVPKDGAVRVTTTVRTLDKPRGLRRCLTMSAQAQSSAALGMGLVGLVVCRPWRRRTER